MKCLSVCIAREGMGGDTDNKGEGRSGAEAGLEQMKYRGGTAGGKEDEEGLLEGKGKVVILHSPLWIGKHVRLHHHV